MEETLDIDLQCAYVGYCGIITEFIILMLHMQIYHN